MYDFILFLGRSTDNLKIFIDLSLSLCCYFKNAYSKYSRNIEICIGEFDNLVT